MYACISVCVCVCVCACIHIHTHTHTCMYAHLSCHVWLLHFTSVPSETTWPVWTTSVTIRQKHWPLHCVSSVSLSVSTFCSVFSRSLCFPPSPCFPYNDISPFWCYHHSMMFMTSISHHLPQQMDPADSPDVNHDQTQMSFLITCNQPRHLSVLYCACFERFTVLVPPRVTQYCKQYRR